MANKSIVVKEKAETELAKENNNNGFSGWIGNIDRPFLIMVLLLMSFGIIMIFTASYPYAKNRYGNSFYFAGKQGAFAIFGSVAMIAIANFIRPKWIKKWAWVGYLFALAVNAAVAISGFSGNGAQRWIEIGPISFQPSEILKFMTVIICARVITDNQDRIKKFRYGILPFIVILIPAAVLMVLQSHLSALIITMLIIYFMMLLGGSSMAWLGSIGLAAASVLTYVVTNTKAVIEMLSKSTLFTTKLSHVYKRLLVWEDPFEYMRDVATNDAGWQPAQSLYAISSGGVIGVGLGKSMQKHGYLPEPQNDYIFAILCEELGFVGSVAVILLFAALIVRGFQIARNCTDTFYKLVAYGLMIKMGLQVVLNIAVVTNTIPSTGISLPFFSYGGTALMITLAEMGIVLAISKYSYNSGGNE